MSNVSKGRTNQVHYVTGLMFDDNAMILAIHFVSEVVSPVRVM